jgi:uncharacterized protein (DUF2147 family)
MRHDHHAPKAHIAGVAAAIAGLLVVAGAPAALAQEPPELGLWYNNSGKGAVEIRPCGPTGTDADRLCGFIVWLKQPNGKNGKPLTDGYNAKPSMRSRTICGLPVLGSLRPMSDGSWDQGWVYDPEQGKSFDAAIQLRTRDQLVLTGYKGIKLFSKSFIWQRAPDDLPRCNQVGLEREARATGPAPRAPTTAARAPVGGASATPPIPGRADQARAGMAGAITPPRPVPAVKPGSATP